jgi:hypothetical protein
MQQMGHDKQGYVSDKYPSSFVSIASGLPVGSMSIMVRKLPRTTAGLVVLSV